GRGGGRSPEGPRATRPLLFVPAARRRRAEPMSADPEEKIALRRALVAERRALDPAVVAEASERIAARVVALPEIEGARTVALYQALRNEIGMEPLWRALEAMGKRVLFPRVRPHTRVLGFAPVDDPAELVVGALGVREPPREKEVEPTAVDVFVV